jgi:prepilin-type N-terminal cleavage/methylation domain-containing protein
MRQQTPRKTRGFTLAEMLISLALMAVLVAAAAVAIYAAEASHAYNSEKNELITRARGVLDRISTDIRRANSFTISFTITGDNVLDVNLPSGLVHTYAYSSAGGGTLLYTETDLALNTTTPIVMTPYVQSFTVTDRSPACLIQLALKGTLSQCQISVTATPAKALF